MILWSGEDHWNQLVAGVGATQKKSEEYSK